MEYQKRTARVRRIILRAFCIGIILLSVGAVVIVYLVTEVPRHYHPLAPVVREEVHAYLTHYLVPGFYNNIKLDEPFEIIVLQQELNEIIVDENTLGWSWPVCLSGVSISAPQVVFLEDTIQMMATVDYAGFPVVMTVIASPKLDGQGKLWANIKSVKAGAINITPLARYIAGEVMADQLSLLEQEQWVRDVEGALLRNEPFDPVFPVYQSDRSIRLISVEVSAQKVVLGFAPAK